MNSFLLFETTALSDDSPAITDIRLGTVGYNDASAPGYFAPDISETESITVERGIYPSRLAFGFGDEEVALVSAQNLSGKYDHLADYGFGREGVLKIGRAGDAYGEIEAVFTGNVTHVLAGEDVAEFAWRSRSDVLDRPVGAALFEGSNADSPSPLTEGTTDDIGGQRKPRAGGVNYNQEPVLVNAPLRIYCWRWNKEGDLVATHSLDEVRLGGSTWTAGADYATLDAMLAASPTVGTYVTCLAKSALLMGGSNPLGGGVRIDFTVEEAAADRYASALAARLIIDAGLSIDTASFDALATAMPYEAGYYNSDDDYRTIIAQLMGSVLGWAITSRTGPVVCGTLPDLDAVTTSINMKQPTAVDPLKSSDLMIKALRPILSNDDDLGAAVKEVRVGYYPNDNPLTLSSIAAAVDDDVKVQLAQAFRLTNAVIDSAAAAKHANAVGITHYTRLTKKADADAVCLKLASIVKRRKRFVIEAGLSPELAATLNVGDAITVTHPRYGFEAGQKVVIVREAIDAGLSNAEFEVLR